MISVFKKLMLAVLGLTLICCTPTIMFIPFDSNEYSEVNSDEVEVYNNRLEIGTKYDEIGVLKIKGTIDNDIVKVRAGIHGADGVVRDGKNFILIKYQEVETETLGGHDALSI
ncbi:MAG: hypothetical protein HN757_09430 [Calditrichaeota bacterium]|jgi:hypothetical protein|nr:hypothetical protein [Bacteroidota bacterium]MBT7789088.1 hypothetical protein [Calditrichota bacterium]